MIFSVLFCYMIGNEVFGMLQVSVPAGRFLMRLPFESEILLFVQTHF